MKKLLLLLSLIPSLLFAQDYTPAPLNIKTQDGTVNTYPYQVRVTNGTLTDNGDGTASLTMGGGGTPSGNNTDVQFNDSGAFGGNDNFVFDKSTGYVGIGTSSPASQLHIVSASGGTASIGIGLTNPAYALDVVGDVNITSGNHYKINGSNLTYTDVGAQVAGSYATINNPAFTGDGTIADTSPSWGLIDTSDNTGVLFHYDTADTTWGTYQLWLGTYSGVNFSVGAGGYPIMYADSSGNAGIGKDLTVNGNLTVINKAVFGVFAVGGSNPTGLLQVGFSPVGLVVLSNGKVGIGTTSPNYTLDVVGDTNIASGSHYKVNGTNLSYTDVGALASGGNAASATYASTVTLANDTASATDYLVFADTATGNIALKTNTGVTVNPSTATVTATTFIGALTGTASGNPTASSTTTWTNKRNTPRKYSTADISGTPGTLTPEIDTFDYFEITAQAHALDIANESTSTPTGGEVMIIAITSDATPRALTYGTNYVAKGGVALPTTTVASKTTTLGFKFNAGLGKWNLLAVGQES